MCFCERPLSCNIPLIENSFILRKSAAALADSNSTPSIEHLLFDVEGNFFPSYFFYLSLLALFDIDLPPNLPCNHPSSIILGSLGKALKFFPSGL